MIDPKIFTHGATSIEVMISVWKSDKKTAAKYKCVIRHENHSPSMFSAERETALAAEREACEAFLAYFSKRTNRVHPMTMSQRPTDKPALPEPKKQAKPVIDDYEY